MFTPFRLVVFLLFIHHISSASIKEELQVAVHSKNIDSLEFYFKQKKNDKKLTHYWNYQRTIIADYYEGICEVEYHIPDKDNPAIHSIYTYVLEVIYQKSNMIFYRLSEKKNKKENKEWVPYLDLYDSYINDSLYKDLEQSFEAVYMAKLNATELFTDHIVFGAACGYIGMDPKEKTLMDNYAAKNDAAAIQKWMQSTNTEKQLYGLYGMNKMINAGYKPNALEEKMMETIRKKKGTVRTCSGCIFGVQPINFVFSKIKTVQ